MLAVSYETRRAIISTWNGIASDAYEACDDDNEIAIELVIDANRLLSAGYPDADREIRDLCMQYGFGVVCSALSKNIQLL
jgi:hypothetical protein